jgi:hypothetical protein
MDLRDVPAYGEGDWHRDRKAEADGQHLTCPNCGRGEWFHPLGVPPSDGALCKYRACKVCGFWQEADGTPACRSVMTAHGCLGPIEHGQRCRHCGTTGPRHWHVCCPRVLRPHELGLTSCHHCGTVLTRDHVVPWPVTAP